VVQINEEIYYIIEAKNERKKLNIACKEAKNYGDLINRKNKLKASFVTGIAGNDDEGFIAKSFYFNGKEWDVITENEAELTWLLSKNQIETILINKDSKIKDIEISDEEFIESADRINEILRENAIPKDTRGKFISALLLALSDGSEINLNEKDATVLISVINAKVDSILYKHKKQGFSRFIKIDVPSSLDNHIKHRTAIVKTIQELLGLNIRSAMKSGKDILGKFYEVFLKYGNGAKEIGIVLTPRHITQFSAEILDIQYNDLVLDPTCGTGGFLVSALDEVRRKNPSSEELDNFKNNGLYGIEEQDPVIALALVNMIFRGDGKNNMKEGNCFNNWYSLDNSRKNIYAKSYPEDFENRIPPITKVLMNPPFAQKSDKNKEYKFIEHSLKQMQDEGILFSILPVSVLIEKSTKQWRKDLLKSNTLLSVLTFPDDLFYPTGTHTLGVFIKKGIPHPKEQKVFWVKIRHDGYLKKKGKRLKNKRATDELEIIKESLKNFIKNQESSKKENIPEFKKICKINFDDSDLELVPESYLDDREPDYGEIIREIETLVKETAGYLLNLEKKNINIKDKKDKIVLKNKIKYFEINGEEGICNVERKYAPYLNEIESDIQKIPYITTTELNNGVSLRCDTKPNFKKDSLTVSLDGKCGTTFYQFEDFISGEKTAVVTLKEKHDPYLLFYIGALIRLKSWRYHYGRKLSMGRLTSFELPLPVNNKGEIDSQAIEKVVKNSYGWEIIDAHLK